MSDIVERLQFDAARCEATFSRGVASNIEEAIAEIKRLREALASPQPDPVAEIVAWLRSPNVLSPADSKTVRIYAYVGLLADEISRRFGSQP